MFLTTAREGALVQMKGVMVREEGSTVAEEEVALSVVELVEDVRVGLVAAQII